MINSKNLLDQISALANDVPSHLAKLLTDDIAQMTTDNWTYARNQIVQSMPQPNLRVQVGQILDTWHKESPDLSPQSIALAILAATQTAEHHRRAQSTSLVWTGPTSHGAALRRTDQALLQVINAAQQQLLVVSFAVYKIANIRKALVKAAARGVDIKICVEAPEPSEGKITYDTIKALGTQVANNATVYIWPKDKRPQADNGKHGSLHVKCAVADKALLFTEGCQEGGPHHGSWALGERYARSIINDLNRWTVGWIDWNLLLDETGGPNHVGNLCSAPVMADRAAGTLMHQSSFWYLGHFARFIRPGARRVLCASTRNALEATAFVHPDGSRAVVAMNRQETALPFALRLDGQAYEATLPPRSIATFIG